MTKLYTLAAACGATNAYENSPKIGFDPEAWAKFEQALSAPAVETVAVQEAKGVRYVGACPICHGNRASVPVAPKAEPTRESVLQAAKEVGLIGWSDGEYFEFTDTHAASSLLLALVQRFSECDCGTDDSFAGEIVDPPRAIPAEQAAPPKASQLEIVERLAKQWDGCEYELAGVGLVDIGDAIRRAGFPMVAAHPHEAADRSAEAKAVIDAAILWAYCPSAGGYRDGWSVEDTCEQLTSAVEAYTGFVNADDPYWTEEEMRAAMGTPAAAEPGKGEGK